MRLTAEGRLVEGEFRPGGTGREWTDAGVLRMLRRRSLAKLRHEIEPVDQAVLGRFATTWQGIVKRRRGADALLDAIEQLQGAPLPASILETEILPARIDGYDPGGSRRRHGGRRGRLGRRRAARRTRRPRRAVSRGSSAAAAAAEPRRQGRRRREAGPLRSARSRTSRPRASARSSTTCASRGASFFGPLHDAVGGGYPAETVDALWNLVWQGLVTNDTFHALRAFTRARAATQGAARPTPVHVPLAPLRAAVGRRPMDAGAPDAAGYPSAGARSRPTNDRPSGPRRWRSSCSRATASSRAKPSPPKPIPGGFGVVYPVLKAMEETGRLRRGYFVAGLGATQFALPGALDLLRSLRDAPDEAEVAVLAATDPANPYGATLKWPSGPATPLRRAGPARRRGFGRRSAPARHVGATVILVDGALAAYLARGDRQLLTFLPDAEPERSKAGRAIARVLIERARTGGDEAPRGMLIEEIDGGAAGRAPARAASRRGGVHHRRHGLSGDVRPTRAFTRRALPETQRRHHLSARPNILARARGPDGRPPLISVAGAPSKQQQQPASRGTKKWG